MYIIYTVCTLFIETSRTAGPLFASCYYRQHCSCLSSPDTVTVLNYFIRLNSFKGNCLFTGFVHSLHLWQSTAESDGNSGTV